MANDRALFQLNEPHGPGDIYFIWQNGGSAQLIATTGSDGTVAVFNRQGQSVERINLQSMCAGFAWDCEGDILAIITTNSSQVIVWDSNSYVKNIVDTGLRDPLNCIVWSKQQSLLAIGTTRGNLAIYNHSTTRRIPILGKHSKRIVCGAWSTENLLALGSDDKTMSLSNEEGDTIRVVQLREIPSDITFAEMKTDERVPGENTISMILGKRTLYLYYMPEPDSPSELGFQTRYGSLIQHKWFGDGYILLGFSMGYVVAISTHPKEMGQELWQVRNHKDNLSAIAVNKEMELVASCGDNNAKIHSMTNLQETVKILDLTECTGIKNMEWSPDGQLLGLSTYQGCVNIYVTKLNWIYAVCPPRIALLTSLMEVSVYQINADKMKSGPMNVSLEIEPSFLAIGPNHLVCGMNNHVWFYDMGRNLADNCLLLGDREYMSEVTEVKLNNEYCAVLCTGKIMLHSIETQQNDDNSHPPTVFPDTINGMVEAKVTCFTLTNEFLVFATDVGFLVMFSIEHWETVIKYRHGVEINYLNCDLDAMKPSFIDNHQQGFIYLPALNETVLIPDLPKNCKGIIWDIFHSQMFIAFNANICITYIFIRQSIYGKYVKKIGETKLLSNQMPLLLTNGELSLSSNEGKLGTITLTTHVTLPDESIRVQLEKAKNLRKIQDAWDLCKIINEEIEWIKLGEMIISDLDIHLAIRIFKQISDAAMVLSLEELMYIEDINLLSGHCAVLLEKYEEAKIFFAKSSRPEEALILCRDLLQWEQAMTLATSLAPNHIPFIARGYAQQLELNGNYSDALLHYEKGINNDVLHGSGDTALLNSYDVNNHLKLCKAGVARTSLRTGNIKRGLAIANELNSKEILDECGNILKTIGHIPEAAIIMEKAENWEEACNLYIQTKNWQKVNSLLPKISSSKPHLVFAKVKESEGNYTEAINGYKAAGDMDSVVRIYIEHLEDPHSASEIVLESRSVEGAKMLAKFYQQIGDFESAIQFLLLCSCISEAYQIAQRQNKLKQYGELLEQSGNALSSDYINLAHYFENEKYTLLAGKYYFLGKDYHKALKLLIKASSFSNEENVALSLAIDTVGSSNDDRLANQLIDFLLGETDGVPKDPKYIFRLYMARKHFKDAAKTAIIIANQEQIAGNYRSAHDLLYSMYQELRRNNLEVGTDMKSSLTLLHRYTLVRIHVKLGNHMQAAKLLTQVASNISSFPTHVVPILTSTVVECNRAGLKKSAYQYAVMLMRPEYRTEIDSKYSKKIEAIVRKAPRAIKEMEKDIEEEMIPCPACGTDLSAMEIICHQCKSTLPICIATGHHISKKDLAACPECDFPCFRSEMTKILELTNECPMCSETVDSNRLKDIGDSAVYLQV